MNAERKQNEPKDHTLEGMTSYRSKEKDAQQKPKPSKEQLRANMIEDAEKEFEKYRGDEIRYGFFEIPQDISQDHVVGNAPRESDLISQREQAQVANLAKFKDFYLDAQRVLGEIKELPENYEELLAGLEQQVSATHNEAFVDAKMRLNQNARESEMLNDVRIDRSLQMLDGMKDFIQKIKNDPDAFREYVGKSAEEMAEQRRILEEKRKREAEEKAKAEAQERLKEYAERLEYITRESEKIDEDLSALNFDMQIYDALILEARFDDSLSEEEKKEREADLQQKRHFFKTEAEALKAKKVEMQLNLNPPKEYMDEGEQRAREDELIQAEQAELNADIWAIRDQAEIALYEVDYIEQGRVDVSVAELEQHISEMQDARKLVENQQEILRSKLEAVTHHRLSERYTAMLVALDAQAGRLYGAIRVAQNEVNARRKIEAIKEKGALAVFDPEVDAQIIEALNQRGALNIENEVPKVPGDFSKQSVFLVFKGEKERENEALEKQIADLRIRLRENEQQYNNLLDQLSYEARTEKELEQKTPFISSFFEGVGRVMRRFKGVGDVEKADKEKQLLKDIVNADAERGKLQKEQQRLLEMYGLNKIRIEFAQAEMDSSVNEALRRMKVAEQIAQNEQ